MLTTALATIFVLGILIFIHELGHFIVAKRVGIKVHRFSLGFPPYIFSKTVGETAYSIGLIPLGGFVKMAGENPDDPSTGDPREFSSKTIGQRAAVIIAGPFMNYVLALIIPICVLYFSGTPIYDPDRIIVGEVTKDLPAANAGLREDDQIIAIDGNYVSSFDSLRVRIGKHVYDSLSLTWLRGADTLTALMGTKVEREMNLQGKYDSIGRIGFAAKPIRFESTSLWEATRDGFIWTHVVVWETVKFVKNLITGQVSLKLIGGPVFIAEQSGKEARRGGSALFRFMALLSVNLAVLNVLPIPILDGGHLMFLLIEKFRGEPVSQKVKLVAQQFGLVILLGLIVIVMYNDIARRFGL
jgi:regulator of sigma E protease